MAVKFLDTKSDTRERYNFSHRHRHHHHDCCAKQETDLSDAVHKHSLQTAALQRGSEKDCGRESAFPGLHCRAPGCSTPEQRLVFRLPPSQASRTHSREADRQQAVLYRGPELPVCRHFNFTLRKQAKFSIIGVI